MISRRHVLAATGGAIAAATLPRARAAIGEIARAQLGESELVYLTPLKSDGAESRCHGEVWFEFDGTDIWVVTASDTWRVEAVRRGLDRARLWVGEFGVWTEAGDAFRKAPMLETRGELVTDPDVHASVLERFGDKYTLEWIIWGPRFRKGLADGSRVLLRYSPVV